MEYNVGGVLRCTSRSPTNWKVGVSIPVCSSLHANIRGRGANPTLLPDASIVCECETGSTIDDSSCVIEACCVKCFECSE